MLITIRYPNTDTVMPSFFSNSLIINRIKNPVLISIILTIFLLCLLLSFCFDWEDTSNTRDSGSSLSENLEFRQRSIFNSFLGVCISGWNTVSRVWYTTLRLWIWFLFRRINTIIITATMDPEPTKPLKQNVTIKFRNLKVTRTEHSKRKNRLFHLIECNWINASLVLYLLSFILFFNLTLYIFRLLTASDRVCSGAATARKRENQFTCIF